MQPIRIFYVFLMVCLFCAASVSADAFVIHAENVSARPGSSVTVSIRIREIAHAIQADAIGFTLVVDPHVLIFDTVDKSGTATEGFSLLAGKEIEPGKIKVVGSLFGQPLTLDTDGLFLKLKFHTPDGARKNSLLRLIDFKDDIKTATTTKGVFTLLNSAYVLGDADNSRRVTLADAIIPLQIIAAVRPAMTSPFVFGDTNGDDKVDLSDVILPLEILTR